MTRIIKFLQTFIFQGIAFEVPEEGKKHAVISLNKPEMVLEKWNGEVRLGISYPGGMGRLIKNGVEWVMAGAYRRDEKTFEFEAILQEKPLSNVFNFQLTGTENLNFFYQPALTQQEIDEGAERPENVVGSYAVYHKTKGVMNDESGMEYKVGKALHIYRPKVTDANGDRVWGK